MSMPVSGVLFWTLLEPRQIAEVRRLASSDWLGRKSAIAEFEQYGGVRQLAPPGYGATMFWRSLPSGPVLAVDETVFRDAC